MCGLGCKTQVQRCKLVKKTLYCTAKYSWPTSKTRFGSRAARLGKLARGLERLSSLRWADGYGIRFGPRENNLCDVFMPFYKNTMSSSYHYLRPLCNNANTSSTTARDACPKVSRLSVLRVIQASATSRQKMPILRWCGPLTKHDDTAWPYSLSEA